jgi:hypothetical protein
MDGKYERGIIRITAVFLIAAAVLIPLGWLGIGPSLMLVFGLILGAVALFLAWQNADEYSQYISGLWLGPVIAAIATIYALVIRASPGELQAIGGIAGIIGVINMLMRPVYRILHYVVAGAIQIGREMKEEREQESP